MLFLCDFRASGFKKSIVCIYRDGIGPARTGHEQLGTNVSFVFLYAFCLAYV